MYRINLCLLVLAFGSAMVRVVNINRYLQIVFDRLKVQIHILNHFDFFLFSFFNLIQYEIPIQYEYKFLCKTFHIPATADNPYA